MIDLRPLRSHQQDVVDEYKSLREKGATRVMIQAACGFGKTLTAAYLIRDAIEQGKRVVFVTPRLTLLDQTIESYGMDGFEDHIGVLQGNHPLTDKRKLLQIASAQTLTRREMPKTDLMIIDEAHMTSTGMRKILKSNPDMIVVGLSATPWSSGLGNDYADLIKGMSTSDLIESGYLVPFKTYAPGKPLDLSKIKIISGDYHQGELSALVNSHDIVGDAVDHYKKYGEDRLAICFAVDRSHAKHLEQRFAEVGIRSGYVDCFTPDLERRELIEDFRSGKVRVICNVGVLTTGFDVPEASCLIDAAPTKSLILHVQKTGRVLRTADGKKDAIILDHAGNTLKLGLITDINRDDLCTGDPASRAKRKEQEKSDPKPRLCQECKTVMAHHLTECPECGTPVKRFTVVQHSPGELSLVGKEQASDGQLVRHQMMRFFGECRCYAASMGYKEGWAAYKFKERYGDWPNAFGVQNAPLHGPTMETLNYIKSKNIAWKKSKEKYPPVSDVAKIKANAQRAVAAKEKYGSVFETYGKGRHGI